MVRNYLKIAWRNVVGNKTFSIVNIGGLALGMTVAILIGLWIFDEFSFNKHHKNYRRIAQVMQQQTLDGEINTGANVPAPLFSELQANYTGDFEQVVITSWLQRHTLTYAGEAFTRPGNFMSTGAAEVLSLKMVLGSASGLSDPGTILLAESTAKAIFKGADPLDKMIKINNGLDVKVVGIYQDIPYNSDFHELAFIAPFELLVSSTGWVKDAVTNHEWQNSSFQILVQLSENADLPALSNRIRDIKKKRVNNSELEFNPQLLLYPMNRWHLYSEWSNGHNVGGRIEFVWLFGTIGMFVLLLACINFMNLSTARSGQRTREVGVRKAVGSLKRQLVGQFLTESFLVVSFAFLVSLVLTCLALPMFNEIADKQMHIPWKDPGVLASAALFAFLTALIAGSYPAFHLSSFEPIKAIKGNLGQSGRRTALPRKVLVVVQFTVSIILMVGTIVVYKQILHTKDRPIGYTREGLLTMLVNNNNFHQHIDAALDELVKTGTVTALAESQAPPTEVFSVNTDFNWKGKAPGLRSEFATIGVSHSFGKTVGWKFLAGRDFDKNLSTDSSGIIINEAAVKFMGLGTRNINDAIGEIVSWDGRRFRIIGVINDMVMESPYDPVKKSIFFIHPRGGRFVTVRLNPTTSPSFALKAIEIVFKKYSPGSPFNFQFVDQEYALKFATEERVGTLAAIFTVLAITISCLGLFGMASFVAQQRTKEIGIRKVMGASLTSLWKLLSVDFVVPVVVSCLIATPIAWHLTNRWLESYAYHTEVSWLVFVASGLVMLALTTLTISYRTLRAALMDPVKSLRAE